ncbi:uncharacterized protein METZ01_LOCUS472683, partial [marine metagenome]
TRVKNSFLFGVMLLLLALVGTIQSWNVALAILNMCLISAVMTMGVNIQYGYAGVFNVGVMGFTALGGIAAVVISMPPVQPAWQAGGHRAMLGLLLGAISIVLVVVVWKKTARLRRIRYWLTGLSIIGGYTLMRIVIDPAIVAIEAVEPAKTGFLGGFGLPIMFSWIVGGVFAAAVAWVVGKVSLGLRSDYLAIATLGISEIIIYFIKYEEWLTRGVKNVNGIPRPVPYEIDLQNTQWMQEWTERLG